jgi:hypothetical protein
MLPRRLAFASLAVLSTILVGTGGYYAIGRGAWTLVDCLYQTDHLLAGGATLIVLGEPDQVRQLSAEAAAG